MEEQMVEGLSGVEIIEDFLDQIRRKLNNSCDLRSTDCYDQGYSGTAEIHLKMYDMDSVKLDMKIEVPAKVEPPVTTEDVVVTPVEVVEKIEIPQELNLEEVRNRSSKSEIPAPPEEVDGGSMPTRLKRKYTRRVLTPEQSSQASGGSVDLDEKF